MSPTELKQAQKFNLTTGTIKSIIATIAVLATVAGGVLGKEILIDETTITAAVESLYQAYLGIMAIVAAGTFILRFAKNVYSNWARITEHGVKISGPNANIGFDFAPKNGSGGK